MKLVCGDKLLIKVVGGILNKDDMIKMYEVGVIRFGISRLVVIVEGKELYGGY